MLVPRDKTQPGSFSRGRKEPGNEVYVHMIPDELSTGLKNVTGHSVHTEPDEPGRLLTSVSGFTANWLLSSLLAELLRNRTFAVQKLQTVKVFTPRR